MSGVSPPQALRHNGKYRRWWARTAVAGKSKQCLKAPRSCLWCAVVVTPYTKLRKGPSREKLMHITHQAK